MGLQYHYISKYNIYVLLEYFGPYFCVVLPSLKAQETFGNTLGRREHVLGLQNLDFKIHLSHNLFCNPKSTLLAKPVSDIIS